MVAAPRHATLTAGAVTTLDMGGDFETVEVTNVDGAAAIYFTTNGSTPAVEGTGSHVVVAGVGAFTGTPRMLVARRTSTTPPTTFSGPNRCR
jgi:hypothetical protein